MFPTVHISLSLFSFFLTAMPGVQVVAPVARDDVRVVIDGHCDTFKIDDLLTNDLTQGAPVEVEWLESPRFGDLEITSDSILYRPSGMAFCETLEAPHLGMDFFTYRLSSGGQVSQPATVWIRFIHRWTPISGSWSTESCPDPECEAGCLGQPKSQIGFYDHLESSFHLCDWQSGRIQSCEVYPLPFSADGWMPLAANLDSDPWDELGIQNPENGEIHWFKVDSECAGPACLGPLSVQSGIGAGRQAIIGKWDPAADPLGFHDLQDGTFWLSPKRRGFDYQVSFGRQEWSAHPLAFDWYGQGFDTVGLFDHELNQLHYRVDHDSGTFLTLDLVDPTLDSSMVLPVTGRLEACDSRSFIGLYYPGSGVLAIHQPFIQVPVHVVVSIDPGSGDPG